MLLNTALAASRVEVSISKHVDISSGSGKTVQLQFNDATLLFFGQLL